METRRFTAAVSAWVFAVGLPVAFGIFLFVTTLSSRDPNDKWIAAALTLSLVGLGAAWVGRFQIIIGPHFLEVRSLFGGTRSIEASAVAKVRLAWEIGNGLQGPLRLVIEPTRESGQEIFSVNAKVFSREAIAVVLRFGEEVAQADDGGLRDGVVMRKVRSFSSKHPKAPPN